MEDVTGFFFDLFHTLPQQGPGDTRSTHMAWSMLRDLPPQPRILDIGCGSGRQTLDLAAITGGPITAVDIHRPFLDELRQRAIEQGCIDRITIHEASMDNLPFEDASFDIVWSEGAVFIMGFNEGIRAWTRLLRPGGWMAVTDVAWLRPDPPEEIAAYWNTCYPAIQSIEGNIRDIGRAGLEFHGCFTLPSSSWSDTYFAPLERRVELLRPSHAGDASILAQLDEVVEEIRIFREFHPWYSYLFSIMRRPM